MTDEERLRNAGWSPNSLRSAMGAFDSSDSIKVEKKACANVLTTGSRQDLKRSTHANVSTPTSSLRGFKLVDHKSTPNFPSRNESMIDLSVSTVKKPICSLQSARDDNRGNGDDDDIMVLTQRFRRQSIDADTMTTRKVTLDQIVSRDENSSPSDQNCVRNLDQNTPNRVCKQFNFEVVSPTSNPEKNLPQKVRSAIVSSDLINAIGCTTIRGVTKAIHDVDQSSQMSKLIAAADLDSVLPNGWKLFKHQKDAVVECLKLGRTIMAFDMGLGKTIISLVWAKAVCTLCPDCIAIIIVPCTLTEIWKREAEMIGFTTVDIHSKNAKLKQNKKVTTDKVRGPWISIHSWSKIPSAGEINQRFVLIADEAHAMQSITSIRTKNTLSICLHGNCLGLVLSTGTPMKNGRPSNILPLLIGIRHPVAQNKIEFEKKYCNAKKTKFCAWDVSGASNLEDLRSSIGPYLMRKTKVNYHGFEIKIVVLSLIEFLPIFSSSLMSCILQYCVVDYKDAYVAL
jgi:SNF2 family DNA or RNA helicase